MPSIRLDGYDDRAEDRDVQASDRYVDGSYFEANPTYHVEDSAGKAQEILPVLERLQPASVCDVGCGAGAVMAELAAAFPAARFVGYDISPQALALAQTRSTERLSFRLASVERIDERFDVALYLDVVEHVEDCFGFLRAAHAVADTHVFRFPLDLSAQGVIRGAAGLARARTQFGHLHFFTRDTALWALTDTGFEIESWRYLMPFVPAGQPLRSRITAPIRRGAFRVAREVSVRALGGYALEVIAR